MVLEKFGSALKNIFNKITGSIFLDKSSVDSIVKELRYILIEADVDIKLIDELTAKVRALALDEKIKGIERKEQLIKLIHDEVVKILGKESYELKIDKKVKPYKIMFLGLYGSGKTTTIAKLALYYSKRGHKVCMLGLDVHRPAAPEQLEQLGNKINVPAFINKEEKNPLKIVEQYENSIAKYDLCFIDTAGRDALNSELIREIKSINEKIKPENIILVMPADIGQAARKQASEFKNACKISGVIITRMDGSAKGGGALAACYETSSPVLFIGTGEHINDIETFNPTSFVSRMLGMGDIEALIEKVKTAAEPKKEIKEEKFTLTDFYEQIKASQSVGPLNKIAEFIPGLGNMKIPTGMLEKQQEKMKRWKYAIDSMTLEEIENPEVIKETRIARIAKGSGITSADVRELINQYNMIKGMIPAASKLGQGLQAEEGKFEGLGKGLDQRSLGNLGLSQKQLRKLAKRMKGVRF